MARSFPTSTDFLKYTGSFPASSAMTLMWWVKNPSINDFYTYIYHNQPAFQVTGDTTGTARISLYRNFSGTSGQWYLDSAAHGMTTANWNHYAWTHDGSSVANNALFYANGVLKTVTLATAPVGTVVTTANDLYIGRWVNASRNIGGSMAYVSVHNVVLTSGEIQEAMIHGFTTRGLVAYWPIFGVDATEPDYSGTKYNLGVNGTVATAQPPVTVPLVYGFDTSSHARYQPAPAAGGTGGSRLLLGVGA